MEDNLIKMVYYFKRGNKYYFKSDGFKLMINTSDKLDIKRNQEVLITYIYGR